MATLFTVQQTSKKSRARLATIQTRHGTIKTPAFVPVATKGSIKSLTPDLVEKIGIQVAFVNTYHLVTHPGADLISHANGIHQFSNLQIPLMSDSGGFQVFSLAQGQNTRRASVRGDDEPLVVKINDDGVIFRSTFDGSILEFTPEKSIAYQRLIGADLIMAFDECTYYPATHEYAKKAMKRTHDWLSRCIKEVEKPGKAGHQHLYGIIQGGTFQDLRQQSAEYVVAQNTPGIAIGGVSVKETKREMRDEVGWVAPYLPADRPVHLLGVGQIDDIVDLVQYGIDTFDCVEPTRIARMGAIYQLPPQLGAISSLKSIRQIEIMSGQYRLSLESVDPNCNCHVCVSYTKAYLHHLFKQRELLGYTLATFHNLWVMERLMAQIRKFIEEQKI